MSQHLLILGATARAAAQSARDAGFRPWAADLFADEDLRACCPAIRVRDYPRGLVQASRQFPAGPWLYTGALENHADWVAAIARERPLLGNGSAVLREVRDPWKLAAALRDAGLCFPPIRRHAREATGGIWLRKPFRSAAGHQIERIEAPVMAAASPDRSPPTACEDPTHYVQQRVPGRPHAALYVACRGQARLLGVTRQLLGCSWAGAVGYQYTGSLGPVPLPGFQEEKVAQIGACLAGRFGLEGLFGVDCLVDDEDVWTVEVNPRYTASVEVLERSLQLKAIQAHVAACREGVLPERERLVSRPPRWGKAIVFARRQVGVTDGFAGLVARANAANSWPSLADTPAAGSQIAARHPIATVFASGATLDEVEQRLRQRAGELYRVLEQGEVG